MSKVWLITGAPAALAEPSQKRLLKLDTAY